LKRLVPVAIAAAALVGVTASSASAAPRVNMHIGNPTNAETVTEAGSSLLEPFLSELVTPLSAADPNITFAPAAGGSGLGITNATTGVSDLGGTDAYLAPAEFTPGVQNIPVAVSSQSVDYNLPGIKNLKLSGSIIAQIFQGTVTTWNAPAIAKLNPGVTLPSTTIVPVHRSDSSGDTFLFTSFLSATSKAWAAGPAFNTTVAWPTVSGELTADGNPGMVQTCGATPGCIAYIGISAQKSAVTAKLGQAELQNAAGKFVLPSTKTVDSAVAASTKKIPANLALSMIYAKGAQSYPIVNFEYLAVKSPLSSADLAKAVRTVLAFAINPKEGSSEVLLSAEQFEALPSSVIPAVEKAIAKISG
jgi:phosphate transport system substrate-binding protein